MTALIRSLPKELRRALVPVPDVAAEVLARAAAARGPLLAALARELERAARRARPAEALGPRRGCPPHLRMRFRVEDEHGAVVAEGNDLDALRERARPRLRAELAAAARGARAPRADARGRSARCRGRSRCPAPAGPCAATRRSSTRARPSACACSRRPARRRRRCAPARAGCCCSTSPSPLRARPGRARHAQRARAGRRAARRASARCSTTRCRRRSTRWSPRPAARRGTRRASRGCATTSPAAGRRRPREVVAAVVRDPRRRARRRAPRSSALAAPPSSRRARDVARQLGRLVHPGFVAAHRRRRGCADVERYLRAAARRLERLPDAPRSTATACARSRARGGLPRAARRWPRGRALPRRCARSRGCSRSCASASSRRGSARAARCRPSGSAARSTRRPRRRARTNGVRRRRRSSFSSSPDGIGRVRWLQPARSAAIAAGRRWCRSLLLLRVLAGAPAPAGCCWRARPPPTAAKRPSIASRRPGARRLPSDVAHAHARAPARLAAGASSPPATGSPPSRRP